MRFAFLGFDSDAHHLVNALLTFPEHKFTAICEGEEAQHPVPQVLENIPKLREWDRLLEPNLADWVIVSRKVPLEARHDQLRVLLQAEIPLIVTHPCCESILAYELEMIRADVGTPLVPFFPELFHPAISELARLRGQGSASEIGTVDQLVIERFAAQRTSEVAQVFMARDAAIARLVVGELNRVSAMAGMASPGKTRPLSVTLSGPSGTLVQWSLNPADSLIESRYTLVGDRGRAILHWSSGTDPRLEINANSKSISGTRSQLSADVTRQLELAQADQTLIYGWTAACRDLEIAETAETSARRGRTVELNHDAPTEQSSFKAVMSVGGCGILTIILFVIGVWGVFAGIELGHHRTKMPDSMTSPLEVADPAYPLFLRIWPVYPLAFFLLMQLLLLVARGRTKPVTAIPAETTTEDG